MYFVGFLIFGAFNIAYGQCPDLEEGLELWSDASRWGGELPGPGDVVTIDVSVLLDVTSVTLSQITISGNGRLIISDQVGDITITVEGILVQDSGSLIIGSEECRFQNNVNIRLTGTRTANRSLLDGKGEKFIAVEDQGTLQIYGQEKLAWTKLTQTVQRWAEAGASVIYSHSASQFHADKDRWNEGLAMYIFYDCNEQPKYYRVFDFDQNGNTEGEQNAVDQMIEALNGVEDNEIVAIATQRRFSTTANLTDLFSSLESMSGLANIALRNAQDLDPYALVFQKGGDASEAFETMIGTDVQVARASILISGKKVTAVSTMKAQDLHNSRIDFHILSEDVGYPTLAVLDDVSSWQPGDEVIVTTTDFSPYHTEKRTIKEIVSANSLKLSDELDYRHFGEIEDGVDMRAEVALLTRNIKIQGVMERGCPESNENCDEFDHDTYGAHVKIFNFTSAHIEGVELKFIGQTTDNGFYPVHFHMCQDIGGKEAVIKSNSFHNSYARCTTIHGTWGQNETHHGVQIIGNAAYDIIGHCYFLEDGAEKATILDGNLGAYIKNVETNGFETDRTGPTVFWITNPKVILTNNVAAGAEGFGIWYVFPKEPVGPSMGLGAYQYEEAERTPIWKFDNNVVHSNGRGGMRFDDVLVDAMGAVDGSLKYMPLSDPFDKDSEPVKAQISRLTSYKNFRINTWLRGGYFELMQYSSAESRRGVQLAKGNKQHVFVKKSIFVGRSAENCEDDGYPDAPNLKHYFGIVQYDGPIYVDQVWFNGFETVRGKYIAGAIGFNPHKTFHEAFSSNMTDIRFGFVDKADGTGGNRIFDGSIENIEDGAYDIHDPVEPTASFRNGDSSVLQCPGSAISPLHALIPESYIATDDCKIRNNWQMIACEHNYGMMKIGNAAFAPNIDRGYSLELPHQGGSNEYPQSMFLRRNKKNKINLGADSGVKADLSQAKRMNRLDELDVAYEDHSERNSNSFTAVLGSDKYYYLMQFIDGFPQKTTFVGLGMERDMSVVVGLCLPAGLDPSQVRLWGVRPPDVATPNDGWVMAESLDEVFADELLTKVYVEGRTMYVRLVSSLLRDLDWDKHDNTHCPLGKCPFLSVELDTTDFVYTPCFDIPTEEANTTMTDETMGSMTCDLPASAPDADWGAGDTARAVIQGMWGEWSSWSECCGNENTTRHRLCDDPLPKGGAECPGEAIETILCPTPCPVDGLHSVWSRWSECFCDGIADGSNGASTRTRACNVENNGEFCWGSLTEYKPCYGGCV